MRRILWTLLLFVSLTTLVVGQEGTANLRLIVDSDLSLTIHVVSSKPVALNGLSFRVINSQGIFQTYGIEEGFTSLRLTGGVAAPGACFIYVQAGTRPVLPTACSETSQVFRIEVPRADVFWFDFTTNRPRDIAIVENDTPTGTICSASTIECLIKYGFADTLTPIDTPFELPPLLANPVLQNINWKPIIRSFDSVEMVLVPTGCFMMGSDKGDTDEQPVHRQCFDLPFWIDRYEVTNAQYGNAGYFSGKNQPRDTVSWFDATAHCQSRNTRLPTEAEWEYAARGPDSLTYPWGNTYVAANVVDMGNSQGQSADVGSRPDGMSWVGAHDVSGNVWEWVSSIRLSYPYVKDEWRENPHDSSLDRVFRGGSWKTPINYAAYRTRSAFRSHDKPDFKDNFLGFRCVRDFQPGDLP